jgi:protoporphyrinogen oxidase
LPFTAVIEMTALVNRKYFQGDSLIYLPRYLSAEDPLWSMPDGEIVEKFLSSLEVMYRTFSRDDVVDSVVSKARQVMPVPTIHYSTESLPSMMTSVKNFMIVNSAQIANGTMNINEIVGLASRKAVELAEILLQQ